MAKRKSPRKAMTKYRTRTIAKPVYRTRTKKVVKKVLNKALMESKMEKEGMTAIVLAAAIGFLSKKIGADKLPAIIQKLGIPATIGLAAYFAQRFGLGGAQAKKYLRPMALSGLSVAMFNLGENLAEGKFSLSGPVDMYGNVDVGYGLAGYDDEEYDY